METRLIFFVIFIASAPVTNSVANANCTVNDISYLCKNIANKDDFPRSLPANITQVTLIGTEKLGRSFPNGRFRNHIWANVSKLSILEFSNTTFIDYGFLEGLEELRFLSISSCPDLREIHHNVFCSTPDLEALHLDENPFLKIATIEAALIGKLSKLKYLSLIGIQSIQRRIVLGINFVNALRGKNLTYLDISGAKLIYIEHVIVQEIFATVKYFNISYSSVAFAPGNVFQSSFFKNIECLDFTGCPFVGQAGIMQGDQKVEWDLSPKVMYLFARDIKDPYTHVRLNARYIFEKYTLKDLKVLDLSKNNIIILNITFLGEYDFQALVTLNLANNNMEYISPSVLSSFPSLKILDLSTNRLHNMQTMNDFSYIFSKNKDLEIICLRNNYISIIPLNLFASNTKLRLIDLSDNELMYFNIELRNVWDLRLINLEKNRLKSLPAEFLGQLEQIFLHLDTEDKHNTSMTNIVLHLDTTEESKASMTNTLLSQFLDKTLVAEKYKYGYNGGGNVKLTERSAIIPRYMMLNVLENHILCDCETLDFIKWILFTDISIINRTTLVCKYGNKEELLNNAIFETVRDNCRIAYIISIGVASSLSAIFGVFTMAILIYVRLRKARQNQDLENLKKEILQDNTNFNFVVFLSYCSQDAHIVDKNILPSFDKYLKEAFNTEKNLVCTGADSFVPGMLIIEEIHRCINESLVVVPVITPAFLESRWSLKECIEAIERHRPVVVLMKQHTDTVRTIGTIKHLIEQYTRATWLDNEGLFVIRPSWNTICDAIIQIAAETFRNYRRQNRNASSESLPLAENI